MESTTTNFQQHQQQQQQQLQDYFVVGSSPLNNPSGYGVSSSLEWNPNFLSTRRTSSNSTSLNNKTYESSNEFPEASGETTASNLSYPTSCNHQLPKIEEDMLSSFPSFSALMNQTTIPTASMENNASINPACTWFNGFALGAHYSPLDHKEHHQSISYNSNYTTNNNNYWSSMHGFGNASLLINQMGGLVSSPHSTTTSVSSSPRLGLNLQASDFLAHNPSLAGVGDEVISPPGKILSNEVSALMNGATGTKRAAGSCNRSSDHQPKSSTSNNTAAANKKSQLKVSCPPFKVRKEKLGDRIAALHQLVSPFGKTDTASVLTEAIGYIQFLQDQIHTLCMPQAKPPRNKPCRPFHMGASISTEDEGKESEERINLRRRGLCLVPSSWTSYITPNHLDGSNLTYF